MKNENDIVLAATFSDAAKASIAQGMLENHGIKSMLSNELISNIMAMGSADFGRVRLSVFRRDLDETMRLLKEHDDIG